MLKRFYSGLLVLLLGSALPAQNIGDPAPDFMLSSLDHGTISLSQYQGKVFFLDMTDHFAWQAGPAVETEINQVFQGPDFQAIGLDIWNGNATEVEIFKTTTTISFPLCLNASSVGDEYGIIRDYGFIVDRDGIIQYKKFEPGTTQGTIDDITAIISELLSASNVEEKISVPTKPQLFQNHPNPFNPNTTIRFEVPEAQKVTLKIFDIQGKLIREMLNARIERGNHEMQWDGTGLDGQKSSSGVYLYLLQGENFRFAKKMTLIR